ncbi:MAG: hypothetical protein GY725_08670 [bacterium]|nr:hypothetical protein [bacterium]
MGVAEEDEQVLALEVPFLNGSTGVVDEAQTVLDGRRMLRVPASKRLSDAGC